MYSNKRYLDFSQMFKLIIPSTFFEKGNSLRAFWDNEYVSGQALLKDKAQFSLQEADTIATQKSAWFIKTLQLTPSHRVLILGCPKEGALPLAFAKAGLSVTGIDSNRMAIEAAQKKAQQEKLTVQFSAINFRDIQFENEFDLVLVADCGFGVFSDEDRGLLLNKIHAALKPNTFFAFNVFTKHRVDLTKTYKDWIIQPNGGFFYSTAHIELINHVHYESQNICLDQHVIFDHIGETHIYNLWDRYYSVPSLVNILKNFKFKGAKLTKDFTGGEHQETDETIAMIVRKI